MDHGAARQHEIGFRILMRRPEEHRVRVRHAVPEWPHLTIAGVIRARHLERNHVGEVQVRLGHDEQAGRGVDRIASLGRRRRRLLCGRRIAGAQHRSGE